MSELLLQQETQEQIFQILFDNDELTWKQIIFNLIETEQMNPWDIDISLIAQKFLEMLKTLKQMDFRISGKIVLASAILLKMKSTKLMEEEIAALDNLINSTEEDLELDLDDLPLEDAKLVAEKPQLVVRTPQPRKRKVSVYDLVDALEQALVTDAKRVRAPPKLITKAEAPKDHIDMSAMIREVYDRITYHYQAPSAETLSFSTLVPSEDREDRVLTFIPLLHLDVQRKIDIEQEEHFGEINVHLLEENAFAK